MEEGYQRPKLPLAAMNEYVKRYSEEAKASVYKALIENDTLNECLSTVQGRLVLDSVVDAIRSHMGSIIRMSVEGFDKNEEAIKQAALQISVAYDFAKHIADKLNTGEEHKNAILDIDAQMKATGR